MGCPVFSSMAQYSSRQISSICASEKRPVRGSYTSLDSPSRSLPCFGVVWCGSAMFVWICVCVFYNYG